MTNFDFPSPASRQSDSGKQCNWLSFNALGGQGVYKAAWKMACTHVQEIYVYVCIIMCMNEFVAFYDCL